MRDMYDSEGNETCEDHVRRDVRAWLMDHAARLSDLAHRLEFCEIIDGEPVFRSMPKNDPLLRLTEDRAE